MQRRDTKHLVLLEIERKVPTILRQGVVQCIWKRWKENEGIHYLEMVESFEEAPQ